MDKCCTKCGVEYPRTAEYFVLDNRNKEGLGAACKKCANLAVRSWYKRNKKKDRESRRKRYQRQKKSLCKKKGKYRKTLRGYASHLIGNIKQRCNNPNSSNYKWYGGRGIKCCFNSEELYNWLVENKVDPKGLDIHRIDNGGNYTLDNIVFLTRSEHKIRHKRIHPNGNN